jgi:hypothetical protein
MESCATIPAGVINSNKNVISSNKNRKRFTMRGWKVLLSAAAICVSMAFMPKAEAQVSIGVNIGGAPPVCSYGYYDYAPYSCAPVGYYGDGYFYNGIFLGVGPWSNWGYAHGWGGHRFAGARGGRYVPGHRDPQDHSRPADHGHAAPHAAPRGGSHPAGHGDEHPR